jgi:cytochrome P450
MSFIDGLTADLLTDKQFLISDVVGLREALDKHFETLLANPALIRTLFGAVRKHEPLLVLPKLAIVSKYDDVIEVLSHDDVFSATEIYASKMEETTGDFVLGMADTPQYQHEKGLMLEVFRAEDIDRITTLVRETTTGLVAAAAPSGAIDVVGGLSRVVPSRLVEVYFGTPGPDEATLMRWMRVIFRDIFLNLENDPGMVAEATSAAHDLNAYLDNLIAERQQQIPANPGAYDDFLSRLVKLNLADPARVPAETIRRILGGTIVGTVDTNSKAICQAIDQLLDRPVELASAYAAAVGGDPAFDAYVWEALRFNPQNPFLLRHCEQDYTVAAGTDRAKVIRAGSMVVVGTTSAMFDGDRFTDPDAFRVDRPLADYIHFGHGLHTCFGKQMAGVLIPETVKALLREKGLSRAEGPAGHIRYDGAFPNSLSVEFEAHA